MALKKYSYTLLLLSHIALAELPSIITFDGYSFPKATEPAAIIELSPIFAPFKLSKLLLYFQYKHYFL